MTAKWWLSLTILMIGLLFVIPTSVVTESIEEGVGDDGVLSRVPRQQPIYGVTHLHIKSSLDSLVKAVKSMEDKLFLHEAREKQFADYSTKTLNELTGDHLSSGKTIQSLTLHIVQIEERVIATESLIQMTDERQRRMIKQISDGLNRLLKRKPDIPLPPKFALSPPGTAPGGTVGATLTKQASKDLKKISRKMNGIDEGIKNGMKGMVNEIKIVGETLGQYMDQLTERHDRLWTTWNTCDESRMSSLNDVVNTLNMVSDKFEEDIQNSKDLVENGAKDRASNCEAVSNDVLQRLSTLDELYKAQEKDMHIMNDESNKAFEKQQSSLKLILTETREEHEDSKGRINNVLNTLDKITTSSQQRLQKLETELKNTLKNSTQLLEGEVTSVKNNLMVGTGNIMDALDDTASQVDNLQLTMSEHYDDMREDIRSLNKVEQVMINTADAVLDTKRSIEFGIRQVILELGDIVKSSGDTINTTISDQIRNISFDILKNQTSALTNMTSTVEKQIGQVWRQIGSMYQEMALSVELLDQIQNTTNVHMNASLSRVGSMDGTVGKINSKVANVEDNLNSLLGRLSLVTSEFGHLKEGVKDELEKLRDFATPVEFVDASPIGVPYTVNRRRHAIHPLDNGQHQNSQTNMKSYQYPRVPMPISQNYQNRQPIPFRPRDLSEQLRK